jgi:alcohol dehydrogenase class IV
VSAPSANYNYPVSYRIGCGRIRELQDICRELGSSRPLVITDPGVASLDWFTEVMDRLMGASLQARVFCEVEPNPAEADVMRGVAAYQEGKHDACILLGGGSAIDVGKCVALMAGNPGSVFDYEDVGDNWTRVDAALIPPMVAVPTTAGTGSEVGRASVIVDVRDHSKKIIFHPKMQPPVVLADPELSFGLPPHLTAATGMDALAHCFEAYCAPGYHPMADGIALEGMRLIREHLPVAFAEPRNAEARTHMMLAASMGATAFQKGLGLVHALSHPLGGATGIHHGLANAIFLPYVMMFNRAEIEERMVHLARVLDLPSPGFEGVLEWMLELRQQLALPHTLAEAGGFDESQVAQLASLAAKDPSMGGNPRGASHEELERCFLDALHGRL